MPVNGSQTLQQSNVAEPPKLTVKEFSAKIKAKSPDYVNVEDNELVKRITEKYPEYKSEVDLSGTSIIKKKMVRNYLPLQN